MPYDLILIDLSNSCYLVKQIVYLSTFSNIFKKKIFIYFLLYLNIIFLLFIEYFFIFYS